MIKFDLLDLYSKAFGFKALPFGKQKAFDFKVEKTSLLGTPLFMPCKLNDIELPNEPLIEISGSKSIVKTQLDGIDGTFKELYAMNDWIVIIRGIAANDNSDEYPENEIRQIRQIYEQKNSVSCVCKLLSYFDINLLSIESLRLPAIEGAQSWQAYELICSSDKAFELEIKNKS